MKVTRRQLIDLISEEVDLVMESSKEYTETMFPAIDLRNELNRINKKLADLETAIEFMGGSVISYKDGTGGYVSYHQEPQTDQDS